MNQSDPINETPARPKRATHVTVHLCIPTDQLQHAPRRRRAPYELPPGAPVPRHGEVIYLSRSSAWGVAMVVHDWQAPDELRVEVWLEHVGGRRRQSTLPAPLTQ